MEESQYDNYSYAKLQNDILTFKRIYPFLTFGNIGYSVLGKTIPYIKFGNGDKKILYFASIHANEWITSPLLIKFIYDLAQSYSLKTTIYGYSIEYLFSKVSLYIVPMVNPDGVDLVTGNTKENSSIYNNFKNFANNYPQIPFPSGWKANFNGVDLKNFQPFSQSLVCI